MPLCPNRLRISLTASTASACAGTAISSHRTRGLAVLAAAHRVFDATEEVLRVPVLRGRAFQIAQLSVEAALIFRQRARNDDVQIHELIAAARAAKVRDALAAHTDHLTMLCSRRNAQLRF